MAPGALGASLLVASRHGSPGPLPPPQPGDQAARDTHVGLLSLVATQGATLRVLLPARTARQAATLAGLACLLALLGLALLLAGQGVRAGWGQ